MIWYFPLEMSSKQQFPTATAFKPSEVASANWSWIILLGDKGPKHTRPSQLNIQALEQGAEKSGFFQIQ